MSRDFDVAGRDTHVDVTEIPAPPHPDGPWDPNVDPDPDLVDRERVASRSTEQAEIPTLRLWRFLPRTLAARLMLGVVSLIVIVLSATALATYFALNSFLQQRLDQQVQNIASDPRKVASYFHQMTATVQPPQTAQKVWAVALTNEGDVLAEPRDTYLASTMNLDSGERRQIVAWLNSGPKSVETTDSVPLRVMAIPLVNDQGDQIGVVALGLSTVDETDTLHRLVLLEVAVGGAAVILALVATYFGVRLSLRPLRRVTSTAREVTAELSPEGAGLDRRVPVAPSEADSEAGQMAESVNTLLGAVETQFAARVASEERMRQFMADASHELRTPLTSIRGYAELARMRRANGTADLDSDADTLGRIESEGTRMSRLVDDLLLLARTDRGAAPQLEPVDTSDLVATAVSGVRAAFPQRRIDVAISHDVPLYGDYDQLLRVLRNLVTNAAVHTAPGGPIRVSAYREGTDSIVRVDDAGPGLPPDEATQVFERFWRADKARTRARGGTGLGMSIVRSIVEAHGGTVRFDSSVESGSTVTVRLPSSPTRVGQPATVI